MAGQARPSEMRSADPEAPRVSRAAVLRCQLHEWYPILRAVTLKTKMIHLDGDFVDYLLADGLVLPEGCEPPKVKVAPGQYEYSSDDWSDEEDGEGDGKGEEGGESAKPRFDQLVGEMRRAIEELGGSVFPKLNWSSPRDAIWINAGENCRCMSPGEVIMLIKSSDFIVHDLCHAFDCCEDETIDPNNPPANGETAASAPSSSNSTTRPQQVVLSLRKWFDIKACYEFRCFVREGKLVAASQRDTSNFYEFLLERDLQAKIVKALDSFYKQEVAGKLSDESLVFDAYVRERDHRVFLIDINPFGGLTQPLLYSWAELLGDEVGSESPELRVIADHPGIRPSMSMYGRLPKEMRDVSTQEGINELVTSCAAMDQVNEAERA